MTGALEAYRNDGPLAQGLATVAGRLPLGALPATLAGVLALVAAAVLGGPAWAGAGLLVFVALVSTGVGSAKGRLDWLVPALLRASEYGFVLWVATSVAPEALPAVFAFLGAAAFHHYDIVYRLRQRGVAPPRWLTFAAGGWDGRMLVVYLLAFTPLLTAGVAVLAGLLGALVVAESVWSWTGGGRRAQRVAVTEEEEHE